jgi:peptide/nickel transport system substrate-binding protein
LIAAHCKEAGIELIINAVEYQSWSAQVLSNLDSSNTTGTFQMTMLGGFQGPDPAALQSRIGTGAGNNLGVYSNSEVDGLFAKALINSDQSYRQPLYYEIQKILSEELPIIPIVNYASFDAQGANVKMAPIQCSDLAGWQELSYTYFED